MAEPPMLTMPASNVTRVRKDGFSKTIARNRPARAFLYRSGCALMSAARRKSSRICAAFHSVDFADEIKFGGEFLQARAQLRATRANIGEQALAFDCLEKGQSRGAHQRAAAKRGTVEAGRKRRGKLLARHESAQREPARERFCNHDNVRQSRKPFVRESQPRAAQAALNFVGDQRCDMLACQFAGSP